MTCFYSRARFSIVLSHAENSNVSVNDKINYTATPTGLYIEGMVLFTSTCYAACAHSSLRGWLECFVDYENLT
jgi:hypothetical protein